MAGAVMSSYFWRCTEDAVVRREYPAGGAKAVAAFLPARSLNAIYDRAALLGLRRPGAQGRPRLSAPREACCGGTAV